jgi:hypothetical protein
MHDARYIHSDHEVESKAPMESCKHQRNLQSVALLTAVVSCCSIM